MNICMCPGHLTVYSESSSAGIVFNTLLNPSVRNASMVPFSLTSISCLSDNAGNVTSSEPLITLAGLVYSAITSIGENGAM